MSPSSRCEVISIIFDTEFIIFNAEFITFATEFIIYNRNHLNSRGTL